MAITTFAAIDVGSSELAMKLFEVSKAHGIVEITHLRHKLSLGTEIFETGEISYKTISEICRVLRDFKKIMKEYEVSVCHAFGTEAIREASNRLVVLDQIKLQTDVKVRILSNSEERFLYYKALSMREKNFDELIDDGALIVDMGAGNVQFSLFNHGTLEFTQKLKLGASRISGLLHALEPEMFTYHELITEYMDKDLTAFYQMHLQDKKIRHVIVVGTKIPEIKQQLTMQNKHFTGLVPRKEFTSLKLTGNFGTEQLDMIIPALLLIKKIASLTKCEDLYMSATDLCDSMVADYAQKKERLGTKHDFTQDILSTARVIAQRYGVDMNHVSHVSYFATEIFDSIRKLHGLGKRERLLLEIGVILHSCGSYVNMCETRENSYKIIMSTEIIGVSHQERVIIANIVRYNSDYFPTYEEFDDEVTKEEYITIIKLCAILKLANVLDKSNKQKINRVSVSLHENSLHITAHTMADITLEKGLFHRKADVFEEVFGIRPVLKKKKRGSL